MPRVIHDISLPLCDSIEVWPGDPPFESLLISSLEAGDVANVTALSMCAHTGTHVDAPSHFLPGGSGVDGIDLDVLIGPAWLADARGVGVLDARALQSLSVPPDTRRLMLRTRADETDRRRGTDDRAKSIGLSDDGARWVVNRGIRLVGIDGLSVAAGDHTRASHVILLEAGVVPLEGLDLSGVAPGAYELVCLPIALSGADGAPARAVLVGTS